MTRTTLRTSRRDRTCAMCLGGIRKGDRYLEHVASPGHDHLGTDHWWRAAECGSCAERHGRSDLLDYRTAVGAAWIATAWEYADVLESHWDGEIPTVCPQVVVGGSRMGEDLGDYVEARLRDGRQVAPSEWVVELVAGLCEEALDAADRAITAEAQKWDT